MSFTSEQMHKYDLHRALIVENRYKRPVQLALRVGYNLSYDKNQRRKAIRTAVHLHTVGSKEISHYKPVWDMIDNALKREKNRIYKEVNGNIEQYEYLKKPWEKRAERDILYLRNYFDKLKIKNDVKHNRAYLIGMEDIERAHRERTGRSFQLDMTKVLLETFGEHKCKTKYALRDNSPYRAKLERRRKKNPFGQ